MISDQDKYLSFCWWDVIIYRCSLCCYRQFDSLEYIAKIWFRTVSSGTYDVLYPLKSKAGNQFVFYVVFYID